MSWKTLDAFLYVRASVCQDTMTCKEYVCLKVGCDALRLRHVVLATWCAEGLARSDSDVLAETSSTFLRRHSLMYYPPASTDGQYNMRT
jgi:hypothetical protein